jgi:hypothetical protein
MGDAELLTNFAQVAGRSALVLHHAGAANHFEIRNLGQVGQNLVLHAIGEESILFLIAQVFER